MSALALLALAAAACALGAAIPPRLAALLDGLSPVNAQETFHRGIATLLALTVAFHLAELAAARFRIQLQARLDAAFKTRLMSRLLELPTEFFRAHPLGDLLSRAGAADAELERLLLSSFGGILAGLLGGASLFALFRLDWRVGLIALGAGALTLLSSALAAGRKRRLEADILARVTELRALLIQIFSGISKIRCARSEARFLGRWETLFEKRRALGLASSRVCAGSSAIHSLLQLGGLTAIFGCTGVAFWSDGLTSGGFLAALGAYAVFMSGMQRLASAMIDLACASPRIRRTAPILAAGSGPRGSGQTAARAHRLRGEIELRHVRVRYSPSLPPALDLSDRCIRIEPGAFVALTGPTGAGKSTLVRALLGLERLESGEILYDGIPLSELEPRGTRRQIGSVLQHDQLIHGSLHENVAALRPLDLETTREAARRAGLEKTLASLPMGMHTIVASQGRAFSGGERQRIMIARAIAGDPRVLILDEATSALDNPIQAAVMEVLVGMRATRIVVAHRMSTIRGADRILALEHGRVKSAHEARLPCAP